MDQEVRGLQESSSRADVVSADNQKLKDAVERLTQDLRKKSEEAVTYVQDMGELRRMQMSLETERQLAEDARALAQRKLEAFEQVRRSRVQAPETLPMLP